MNRIFTSFGKKSNTREPIVVVSGLPRSGTSMMMKILAEGGLPILSDKKRSPDLDNPNGYWELESVKHMSAGNVVWLADARGKAVKVISALLEFLPAGYFYRIIFMEREIQEILTSQRKMLEHRTQTRQVDDAHIKEQLQKHLSYVIPWLARQHNMEALYISYNALMSNPEPSCRRVMEFTSMPLDLKGMLSVPDGNLYRNHA